MFASGELTTAVILEVFKEEVTAGHGGEVNDVFDDGHRLFARSVLPRMKTLRRGDRLQAGVALRANEQNIWLHPYLYRLVCRNGAIIAHTLGTRRLDDLQSHRADDARQFLAEAVASCCDQEAFEENVQRMRSSIDAQADLAINLAPLLSRLPGHSNGLVADILQQFFREGDNSRFGLANAITATARDTRDPNLRWNLEEFGGGLAVGVIPDSPLRPKSDGASLRRYAFVAG